MIGTSDQSCWLAEACKILLLLLLRLQMHAVVCVLLVGPTMNIKRFSAALAETMLK